MGEQEELVRPHGVVVAACVGRRRRRRGRRRRDVARRPVEHIAEALLRRVPETPERTHGEVGEAAQLVLARGVARVVGDHHRERVERGDPEAGELDGLAHARGDHEVADLGVHPGQLQAAVGRAHESVAVDVDAVARAADVRVDDREQRGKPRAHPRPVARGLRGRLRGEDREQRRVGAVVLGFARLVGEAVRQQPSRQVIEEGLDHELRLVGASRGEQQAGQRDHRVAAPVLEPRESREDGAPVAAVGAGAVDDEVVGREDERLQLGRGVERLGLREQRMPALALGGEQRRAVDAARGERRIEADRDEARLAGRERERRGERVAGGVDRVVAARTLLDQRVAAPPGRGAREVGAGRGDEQRRLGGREAVRGKDDGGLPTGRDRDVGRPVGVGIDLMVSAVLDEHARLEPHRRRRIDERPQHRDRALVAQHDDAPLEARGPDLEGPGRHAVLERERRDAPVAVGIDRAVGPAPRGERHARAVHDDLLVDEGHQHAAADGRLARAHEQSVVAPRRDAAGGAERVVTPARRRHPLAPRALHEVGRKPPLQRDAYDRVAERRERVLRGGAVHGVHSVGAARDAPMARVRRSADDT